MNNEEKLASTSYQSAASGLAATATMAQAAKTLPKWQRNLMYVFITITVLATVAGVIGKIGSNGSLPECDAQETRDTLSDLNGQNKFNASKYNFIKTVSTGDSEVVCTANLALWGGGKVEYDYRIFRDDAKKIKVQITDIRR